LFPKYTRSPKPKEKILITAKNSQRIIKDFGPIDVIIAAGKDIKKATSIKNVGESKKS
jgi:hypothetical protein